MERNVLSRAAEFINAQRRKKRWTKAVSAMAAVVVFCTTYALILPAITLQAECGKEAHTHSDACYTVETITPQPTMLCSLETLREAGLHEHTEDCYDEEGELTCGLADFVVHEHDDLCYDGDGKRICTLEEIKEHQHDDTCYRTERTLTCGQRETSGHRHDEDCYERVRGDLICAEDHEHTDDCYQWSRELVCDQEEVKGHTHMADCYETERVLDCDKPEVILHEHDEDCYEENPDDPHNSILVCDKTVVLEHQHGEECIQPPEGDPYEKKVLTCGKAEHEHTEVCYLTEEEAEPTEDDSNDFSLCSAAAVNGVEIRLSGPKSSLPFPADEISVTAEAIINENAAALVDAAVADTELENGQIYLFDVRLWHDGTEIEPVGPVVLTFEGVASSGGAEAVGVFHVDEENEQATDMNAEMTEDGSVVVDTDHFSLYAVMVAVDGGGTIAINQSMSATWDEVTRRISALKFTVSSATDNVIYRVEYSDNDGSAWQTVITSSQISKNTSVVLDATNALNDAPLDRLYRVYGAKDKNNYGYTSCITLYDILDSKKSGFSDWLKNSYVQDFGGEHPLTTQEELYEAFAVYYALPSLTIKTRMDGNTMYVDAQTDGSGSYTYSWEYQNEDGNWVSLCGDTVAIINASSIDLLLDGGKEVRCKIYEGNQLKATSAPLFVNPLRQTYDNAIAAINAGLNLGDLKINETAFTDYFYYGNVAKDSRVPFSDAQSYADYLAKTYLDANGGDAGLSAVKAEWDKYLYDIYDPTTKSNTDKYPQYTYGDTNLEWPKDSTSSFHGTLQPKIDELNYNFLENGVDYSNFVSGLNKTATTVAPGDENTERKYDIDITADAQAKAKGPVAMILQIQTSWQMFDLEHANAVKGDGDTEVGAVANNTELATLYDIKQALLRFVDYMETNYPGNNLVLGITEVQHAKSQTMFSGTDEKNQPLYVTNNYDTLRDGIRNWDSFGNCEHVHYDTGALVNATAKLASNLSGWADIDGNIIRYEDIQKVAVIIGGPTENASSTNGYACTLPWATFQSAGLNSVYGIRTNNGTSNGSGVISWLDYSGNNTGTAFNDGTGTTFTEKYVATTEDAVFNDLVQIAEKEMGKNGIDLTGEDKYVENVKVTDIISDEFVLDTSEPITATIYNKDGSVNTQENISLDNLNLSITENAITRTTTISYDFGTVYNTKKCVLHFRVKAREDYIGSNNVFSNVGTPDLTYIHKKQDSDGNPTGEEVPYNVNCYDTPRINVPIRFTTVDGDTASILVGEQVDLKDLSTEIAKDAEDRVDNYDQINGTLSYTWVLPDSSEVGAGTVTVKNGSIGAQTFPDRSYTFTGTAAGQYTGTLKVTFTPEAVDSSNPNFSNKDTAVPVNPLTNPGNVWINVVAEGSTEHFYVRKDWVGGPPEGTDSIKFRVLADGEPVKDESGIEKQYTLSTDNGWETEVSGLPSVKDGVIQNYTVEEINCPTGYLATYSSETRKDENWAAKVTLSFTPSKDQDNVILEITYKYNDEERTYTVPDKTKYKKDKTYSFVVKDLPLNETGEPDPCEIVSIINTNDKNNAALEVSNKTATAEKYLKNSANTEVKVIANTPAFELPSAGGPGAIPYSAGGLLLLIISGSLLLYNHTKRRKGDSASS